MFYNTALTKAERFPIRDMSETDKRAESGDKFTEKGIQCIHCGDPCGEGSLKEGDNYFCCAGCRAVYNLLSDSHLGDYYSIEKKPGLKPEQVGGEERFDYLDRQNIVDKFLDFNDGKKARVTFSLPQIHCSSCIWLLENLYKLNPYVNSSRVDFRKRIASITFDIQKLSLKSLVILLASIGYEPEINFSQTEEKPKDYSIRKLYARLAVTGFAFGNVMLLSFPEYLGFDSASASYGSLFNIIKIALSIPVVFYGADEFFKPALSGLKQKQINMDVPVSIGILILFFRSVYDAAILGYAGYFDSLCALVFLLLVGRLYQKKTYFSMSFNRDYRSYLPISVFIKNNDKMENVPITELDIGSRMIIRNHEVIPADSILINGEGKIDYSFVTGESSPVQIKSGDRIYAGGRQVGQSIELEVIKKPSQSYLMQLWEQIPDKHTKNLGISTIANRVSTYFTPIILSISLLAGLYWLLIDSTKVMNAVTAVLIVACPCALALASPFTLGTAQRIMGRSKLFLKDSGVIERISRLTSIVFDKTGTITQSGASQPEFVGPELSIDQRNMIYSIVSQSTHPLSLQIAELLNDSKTSNIKNFSEREGLGLEADINGFYVKIGSRAWVNATGEDQSAQTAVYVSIDEEIIGYFRIANLFRKGLIEIVPELKSNYTLGLLSGDNDSEKERISSIFGSKAELHFNQSPQDKLDYVVSYIDSGDKVAMIGDGLNDAGALKTATVGITVAESESNFSPACDGILMASAFKRLPNFFKLAGDSIKIIKISFVLSFLYNIAGLFFAVQGLLSPVIAAILMPASSVTVVLFTTLATSLAAKNRGVF